MFSQKPIIQKTTVNGQNGFIANEVVMDSIMEVHYAYLQSLSARSQLLIEIKGFKLELEKMNIKVDYLTNDNSNLQLQNKELTNQLIIKDQMHEADIMYYKEKAKGKLNSFLFGTALGGLVVLILTVL